MHHLFWDRVTHHTLVQTVIVVLDWTQPVCQVEISVKEIVIVRTGVSTHSKSHSRIIWLRLLRVRGALSCWGQGNSQWLLDHRLRILTYQHIRLCFIGFEGWGWSAWLGEIDVAGEGFIELSGIEDRVIFWSIVDVAEADRLSKSRSCKCGLTLMLVMIKEDWSFELWAKELLFLEDDFFIFLYLSRFFSPFCRRSWVAICDDGRFILDLWLLLLFLWRFVGFVVLLAVVLVLAFILFFGLIILADSHQGLIRLLVGFFEGINRRDRLQAVGKLFGAASNAYKLILHSLDTFDDFLSFKWVSEIDNDKHEIFFI